MSGDKVQPVIPCWCETIDTLFLDLDGCVWFGNRLAEGARETVACLRERGKRILFITNVSGATRSDTSAKLEALGIPATADDVQAPIELLPDHEYLADKDVMVLALCSARVREAMEGLGINVTDDPERAAVVVVGRDPLMTYSQLAAATHALCSGARLLALNLDSRVPFEGGIIAPGAGAIVAALREATGAPVESVGKPSRFFFERALRTFGADPASTVMVGDTLDSDILGGRGVGMRTVLVGGSAYSRLGRPPTPDLELPSIADLPRYFK
jgi:HAD superfamily hydrolase (TIGR01450 family)